MWVSPVRDTVTLWPSSFHFCAFWDPSRTWVTDRLKMVQEGTVDSLVSPPWQQAVHFLLVSQTPNAFPCYWARFPTSFKWFSSCVCCKVQGCWWGRRKREWGLRHPGNRSSWILAWKWTLSVHSLRPVVAVHDWHWLQSIAVQNRVMKSMWEGWSGRDKQR